MKCDLHTHTAHSDGSCSPRELVMLAKEKNLIIALTDHNTTSGLSDFLSEAEREGVRAIGGTELSTEYEGKEFHLVGLFIDPEHYWAVETLCNEFIALKEISNLALFEKLCDIGCPMDYMNIRARNVKGNTNRAHFAAEMVKMGYAESVQDAFNRYLDVKIGLYVPPVRLGLLEAIEFLNSIGAVSVLAHPLKEIDADALRTMLPKLISVGLDAIETMHSSYTDEQIVLSKAIAREFGLLESGGSDFHGLVKPDVQLGVGKGNLNIPEEIYQKLLERKNEK